MDTNATPTDSGCASCASPQFRSMSEQGFFQMAQGMFHDAARLRTSRDVLTEHVNLAYVTEQRVVGTREAKASSMTQPVYGQPIAVGQPHSTV